MSVLMFRNVLLIASLNLFMGSLFLICSFTNIVSAFIFLLLPLLDFVRSSDLVMNTPSVMRINYSNFSEQKLHFEHATGTSGGA